MTYLLNRKMQRYHLRGSSPLLSVAAPDRNPARAAAWELKKGRPSGSYHLLGGAGGSVQMDTASGSVVLGRGSPSRREPGVWRLRPVGDGSSYQQVVWAPDPGLGLTAVAAQTGARATLSPITSDDPASMWLLAAGCIPDARSVHLRYPTDAEVSGLYNEVIPRSTPPGTYLCVLGFGGGAGGAEPNGYAGIQRLGDGSRIAIFSVWHRMRGATAIDRKAPAEVVSASPAAGRVDFSGEGSGVSIRIPFRWPEDGRTPVALSLAAQPQAANTVITASIRLGDEPWAELGSIRRIATEGRLLGSAYSFVEDFLRNGAADGVAANDRSPYLLREAEFRNPWMIAADGSSRPVDSAVFTAYGPHPLENISARVTDSQRFGVRLATGGGEAVLPGNIGGTLTDVSSAGRRKPALPGGPGD